MSQDDQSDPDRAAILARRKRFIALAISGLATSGCKSSPPQPCLNMAKPEVGEGEGEGEEEGEGEGEPSTTGSTTAEPIVEDPGAPVEGDTEGDTAEPEPAPVEEPPHEPKPHACLRMKPKPQPCLMIMRGS